MKRLTNDFSWSKSRHEKLRECLRAYYFHYYLSWGGWEPDAPAPARQLYVLKKLHNRFTWAGGIVHAAIRGALTALREGRPLDPARVIDRVHRVMREDFVYSRARSYWRDRLRKEFSGLVEHEYQEPVAPEEWKANWENVRSALTWFFQSRWIPLARSLKPEQWLEVDLMDFDKSVFHLDGVKIFAAPDFAYLEPDGTPVVVDWKTGKAHDGYDAQVLGYALYLSHRYQLPVSRVRASLVYVNEGIEQTVQVDERSLAAFQQHFGQSVAAMKKLLADPTSNVPLPESFFPQTEDPSICARCVFRAPCGRQAAPARRVLPAFQQPQLAAP